MRISNFSSGMVSQIIDKIEEVNESIVEEDENEVHEEKK